MIDRIRDAFRNPPAFMPYYPLGYPTVESSLAAIEALAKNGADLLEIGLPFSDPLADGPVIQRATQIAIRNGITMESGLELVAALRKRCVQTPMVLMPYFNPVWNYGLNSFATDAKAAGVDAVIIPDLPPEESTEAQTAFGEELPIIRMLAPTTTPERMRRICADARGFLYIVSVTGVTGMRETVSANLAGLLDHVREQLPPSPEGIRSILPLCVGFGISTPEQAAEVGQIADGVIVGSACVKTVGESPDPAVAAAGFARSFRKALDSCRILPASPPAHV